MGKRGVKLPGELVSTPEALALLQATREDELGARHRALLVLLWRVGLRISEALDLRPTDLDFDASLVRVRRGKGGWPRTAGMDPQTADELLVWLNQREKMLDGRAGAWPLLCTSRGKRLQSNYCRALLQRLARRAGIHHRVHLHGLRHTYAVQALRDGLALHEVQAQLGHKDLSTTGIYLRHVAPEVIGERARARPKWKT